MNQMSFMAACRDFFGCFEGQSPIQFGKEVQKLTPDDRAEIQKGLEQNGYEIIVSPVGAK